MAYANTGRPEPTTPPADRRIVSCQVSTEPLLKLRANHCDSWRHRTGPVRGSPPQEGGRRSRLLISRATRRSDRC